MLAAGAGDHLDFGASPASVGTLRLPGSNIINMRAFDDGADTTAMSKDTTTGADYLFFGFNGSGGGFATPMHSIVMGASTNLFLGIAGNSLLTITASDMTITTKNTIQNGLSYGSITDIIRDIITSDDTSANIYTWTFNDYTTTMIDVVVTAIKDDGTVGGSWKRSVTVRAHSGTLTTIGSVNDNATEEESASWDVTISNDGTGTGNIVVTGEAATNIRWVCAGRLQYSIGAVG